MSSRRDYDDRDNYRSRSRRAGREADDYDSHRKRSPARRADSRSRRPVSPRRSSDRGDDRYSTKSRGRGRDDGDYRRSDRRDDDRGRGRDDDRRDDDRGRGRDDDRGRGRDDDRGRGRDRDDGGSRNKKKTGWGDEDKEKEAPPDWLADLVGGSSGDKMPAPTMDSYGGFGGPPPAGTRLNCKTIQIPVDAKPYLIGKQGKIINEIRAKTQSMIQINNNGPGDKFVTVMITGNVDAVEKLIHEHLDGWFTPSPNAPKPNENVLQQIRVGAVQPALLAPPVQLSAANIWNWNA